MNYNGNNNNKIMLTILIIHVSKFSAKCVSMLEVDVQDIYIVIIIIMWLTSRWMTRFIFPEEGHFLLYPAWSRPALGSVQLPKQRISEVKWAHSETSHSHSFNILLKNVWCFSSCVYVSYWVLAGTCRTTLIILTYLLTYGAEPFLRSCQLCSHSENSQQF
jgi:hypothetical protein